MEIDKYFINRHSERQFTDEPISDSDLAAMLDAAQHAPNTGNMQWYSAIVTREPERRKSLAAYHFNQPASVTAPVMVTFCLDLHRFEKWCRMRGAKPGFENLQSMVAAMIDTSLFAQQFCTVAELAGYGTCYLGTTAYNAAEIAKELSLPSRVVPLITVALGRPANAANGGTWRLPVESIMHFEDYRQPTEADIDGWFSPLENQDDSKKFVDENGKTSLAQVFTDVRYPQSNSELFSESLMEYLKENKFV